MSGQLILVTGCMFAGKTGEFARIMRRDLIGRKNVICFKPQNDIRYSEEDIVSHNGVTVNAISIDINNPKAILDEVKDGIDVVGIDEIQFFNPEVVDVCKTLLSRGIKVVCAGLKQDFKGECFGSMDKLLILADYIYSLTAVCNVCGAEATHSQRLIDNNPAPYDAPQVLVGGVESYQARCEKHYELPGK